MGGFQKKIYDSLPYPFKVILLNIKGYLNVKQRYTKEFESYLQEHIKLWDASPEDVTNFQKNKLAMLLSEVLEYSKWYSSIMQDLGITIEEIKKDPMGVLKKMPILEKAQRKDEVESIVNTKRETVMVGHTSGTSGAPTIDYLDRDSINVSFAIWKRFHRVIGVTRKSKQVRLSGRLIVDAKAKKPPFWVYNYFEKQLLMSTYHLTSSGLQHYVNKLNKFKPELIDGYPSAIYVISMYINKNDIKLDFVPKAIAVTSETLYDYQRTEIEKAFDCHVFNQYASNEGSPFITECVNGNLHLNLDSGVFEFVNINGESAKPGEIAKLIVTSYINLKTPLIRYDIGDTVLLPAENEKCSCDCSMPIVKKIIGREDDILWTEEKGYVVSADTGYKGLSGITQGQIIQESPKEITINLVIEDGFDERMKEKLLTNFRDRLGENVEYTVNILDNIPLGPNEKFDAVKRNFDLEF